MKILIGYDGSESSEAMLDDLKLAGLPGDCEILVVSVGDMLKTNPPIREVVAQAFTSRRFAPGIRQVQTHGENVISEAKALAAQAKKRVQTRFPDWDVASDVAVGAPAWKLIEKADGWNADLITVGSQGRNALGSFLLGSVSKKVVTDSNCSVRVARRNEMRKENAPPRIIIGVNDSPSAVQAIFSVGKRVWQDGTEVLLINVAENTSPNGTSYTHPKINDRVDNFENGKKTRIHSILEWGAEELNIIGLKTSISTKKGDPKQVLVSEAHRWNADSIFIGTRGFDNSFERFRLGSFSTAVATNAHCSVEVVRPPETWE